jgi:exonuclease III
MKIATYNVNFLFGEGAHTHSGKEWVYTPGHVEARVDYFASLFKKIDADILFLQELASEEVLKRIIEKTGINYSYFIATPDQNRVGNAVLTKSKECVFESLPSFSPLPVFYEEDIDTLGARMFSRRDFISAKTTYGDNSLFLLGIHLKSNYAIAGKDPSGNNITMDSQISYAI